MNIDLYYFIYFREYLGRQLEKEQGTSTDRTTALTGKA